MNSRWIRSLHTTRHLLNRSQLSGHVKEVDPEISDILTRERRRQKESVTLIPSENFTSKAVMDILGSEFQNKYSEGYPGARYYGGNQFIDQAELLCQRRALKVFNLDQNEWGVNVQSLSGAPANLYSYSGVLQVGERIMGLDLPHGGHLSHGYQTPSKHISYVSKYFTTMPYQLDETTGLINYDELARTSSLFRPKIIVAGASAYSRKIDYARMRKIADNCGAYVLSDISHIAGLVAAGVMPSPFEFSDIVTTTSHKSLRGPRGALIFYRKGIRRTTKSGKDIHYDLESRINFSVFPGHQGGPHNHTIAALAVALKQATTAEFREYQQRVLENAQAFAKSLISRGFQLVSGGTDNHLILIDLKPKQIDGARVEIVLELMNIAVNKNTVPGDKSALIPGGLRVGTPAMTTREFLPRDFDRVAEYILKATNIAKRTNDQLKQTLEKPKLADFKAHLQNDSEIAALKDEVSAWVLNFPVPGDL